MARGWTQPPSIIAAIGDIVVILLTLIPRTTITQHTSGAGSPAIGGAGGNVTIPAPPPAPPQPTLASPSEPLWWKTPPIIAAIITALAALVAALISRGRSTLPTGGTRPRRRRQATMMVFWLLVFRLFALQVHAATIEPTTARRCSPAVGQANNVTIVCQGVDPKALARLNELLDKQDLELEDKIGEAEAWAQKYHELEQRLATEGQDNPLAQQAQALVKEGKLEEAEVLFKRLVDSDVERTAAHQFNLAEVYALQLKPHEALPYYEKAYQNCPDKVEYAFQYALTLQKQQSFALAQPVYQGALRIYRQLAEQNPAAYLPYAAMTLTNLALLYRHMQRLSDSVQAYHEALTTYRQLAEQNPDAYLPDVAMTLTRLGLFYVAQGDVSRAHDLVSEAVRIRRDLWRKQSGAFGDALAQSLGAEGLIFFRAKDTGAACSHWQEAYQVAISMTLKQSMQGWISQQCK